MITRLEAARHTTSTIAQTAQLLAPTVLGLMCARVCLIVATYGSYASTDAGILTDGSSLAAMVPLIFLLLYLGKTRKRLSKRSVFIATNIAIAAQAASIIALGIVVLTPGDSTGAEIVLSTIATFSSWIAIFYWLRRARGTSSSTAAAIAFGSLLLSEPLIYMASLLPHGIACIVVGATTCLQFLFRKKARTKPLPEKAHTDKMPLGYFGFAQRTQDGVRVLGILAFGMFILSVAVGALRGFPNGEAVPFGPLTRVGYMLLVMAFFAMLIWQSFRESRSIMSTTIWLALEMFGIFAVASYAAFPGNPDIGAMFTTVFNAGMTGFMWYLVIAFSSYGKRDPYYYAAAGWSVYILPRALARSAIVAIAPYAESDALQTAIVAGLILASAQIVFIQLIWVEHGKKSEAANGAAPKTIQTLLGLDDIDDAPDDPESIRRALMQNDMKQLQSQFMLSDRETEVLTLYALGLTQRKIAEELCISPGTTHTHIKRIYAKTDLHSRQEVLDYIEQYVR
ncbi:MAG: LuxR C-terminal-related transcriptional regulator [Slackia sp.]|nr:LuxR C-terminal-related transcriptional regulator [Slackia sp.]